MVLVQLIKFELKLLTIIKSEEVYNIIEIKGPKVALKMSNSDKSRMPLFLISIHYFLLLFLRRP